MSAARVVVVSTEELTALIESAVARALKAHFPTPKDCGPDQLTLSETAKLLRCSTRTVRHYISLGRLRASRIDGGSSRVLVTRQSIERLLELSAR